MMKTKKLDIKNPCGQNWDEMKPLQQGRYCSACNHIIHDFSEMSNEDLLQMLYSGKHSCGRFVKEQMGMLYSVHQQQADRKKYWAGIAAAIIAGMLQVNVSYSQIPTKESILMPRSMSIIKGNEEKLTTTTQETVDTLLKTKKLSFRIVDVETKKPLANVRVEMRGLSGITDEMGRIDFELTYKDSSDSRLHLKLFQTQYEEQKVETDINICFNKLNVLYMTRKKLNQNKEYVVGFF